MNFADEERMKRAKDCLLVGCKGMRPRAAWQGLSRKLSKLTELSAQKEINGEHNLGECIEPFSKLSSLVGEFGLQEVQAQVDKERILEERVNHCGQLARRRVIPISTDVGKSEQLNKMALGLKVESFSSLNAELGIILSTQEYRKRQHVRKALYIRTCSLMETLLLLMECT